MYTTNTTNLYVCMYICMYVRVSMYMSINMFECMCIYGMYIHVCMSVWSMNGSLYVDSLVCIYLCIYQ